MDPVLGNTTTFPDMMRLSGSTDSFAIAFVIIARRYGWRRMVVMSALGDDNCDYVSKSLNTKLNGTNLTIAEWVQMTTTPGQSEITVYLDQVQRLGRS